MKAIKQAKIVRFTERNDMNCVDVEVKADGFQGMLLVEFTESEDHDFDMRHVYRKDASNEIDWYDNDLHEAFQDVSEELFDKGGLETERGEREDFKEGVLSFGSIRQEVKDHFRHTRKASLFHTESVENQDYLH